MRKVCFVLSVLALPLPAFAQISFSLPSIGLPLPAIGLQPEWRQRIPWERPQIPSWEKRQLPPWEGGPATRLHTDRYDNDGRHHGDARVIFIPYAVAFQQEPQVIVVQQPPVTRIVQVEVPAPRVEEPPRAAEPPPPPYVPTGDRTLYVIPGCYVGNVSPVNVKLPANCDITKLTTYVP